MKNILLLILFLSLFIFSGLLISCGDDDDDDSGISSDDDDSDDDDNDDDDNWVPVEPHKEIFGQYTVVWYSGTPYEMGYQQGTLLHDELAAGTEWLGILTTLLPPIANLLGLTDLAYENTYPDIIDECQGLVDAAGDVGWTMDICMLLNFGDVLVEFVSDGFFKMDEASFGCSQVAATGDATKDGNLYHARSLDWSNISYLFDYPVIHVRQPSDGIPHVYIGFPGNLSPYNGMNIHGISIGSNEAVPLDDTQHDNVGRSHVQMVGQLLKNAKSLDEVKEIITTSDHMSVEGLLVSDGPNNEAAAFEMTSTAVGIREMDDGVVRLTNHFIASETENLDEEPAGESTTLRLDRLIQLTTQGHQDSIWGDIDPLGMVGVLRDRVNPYTEEESPSGTFDNDGSLATNGSIYMIVYDPINLWFWVASGNIPVYGEPFVGFSLGELLGLPGYSPVNPEQFD